LLFEADTSPGIHDLLWAACDPTRYAELGVEGWHASCQENLLRAMAELGHERIEVPQPINLFMNTPVLPGGDFGQGAAETRPGDPVAFQAELDCIVALSACPMDIISINAGQPTSLAIEILGR